MSARTWKASYSPGAVITITGMASWFGGGADKFDNGQTASGVLNDGSNPNLLGCALPLSWDGANVASCQGSPLPQLPWGTLVEVIADNGKSVTVSLIDVGPSLDENRPIDLTVAAFRAIGGDISAGLVSVTLKINVGGAVV